MEYDNKNTGVLFKNKKENERQPDWKGSFVDANGVEMDLAAWTRTSKKGMEFLSIKVSKKWVAEDAPQQDQHQVEEVQPFNDEVPF